jgi:DNA (cytosine-5)-methyltransferase 1
VRNAGGDVAEAGVNLLDLFSGIGGFSLGLERAGFKTVAFCEIDPFCRRVLAKHWPEVPCYDDVRELNAARLRADGIGRIDAICGGFPCQDISIAGKGAGLAGERSGLWSEYARLVGELRPAFVIVENVAALLGRGLGTVLGDLATLGYDAEWHCIPASAVGAHHRRDRVWIVAYADEGGALVQRRHGDRDDEERNAETPLQERQNIIARLVVSGWWTPEPELGRLADGIHTSVDRSRLAALGNSVVPQIPELIGRALLEVAV